MINKDGKEDPVQVWIDHLNQKWLVMRVLVTLFLVYVIDVVVFCCCIWMIQDVVLGAAIA